MEARNKELHKLGKGAGAWSALGLVTPTLTITPSQAEARNKELQNLGEGAGA